MTGIIFFCATLFSTWSALAVAELLLHLFRPSFPGPVVELDRLFISQLYLSLKIPATFGPFQHVEYVKNAERRKTISYSGRSSGKM